MCVYIYIHVYVNIYVYIRGGPDTIPDAIQIRERNVVFENVAFDNNSSVTPYQVNYSYRIR